MSYTRIEQRIQQEAPVLLEEKGYISPIDLLIKMDKLTAKQVEDWRHNRIPYLEKVISGNLKNLNHVLLTLRTFASRKNLKSSITVYKSWGKKPKKKLRFSKTGNPYMEKLYSTHYVK
ncbi:hypothetical protein [Ornithinibacillus halophilus]|uniref:Uncharacterized protein n=1 Tax=Ornithinibacillus halophilus TaxID=930117 RepID=A0A1M5I5A7_9BACI|nr:hypothetical protein [Ornithinibacillus halophilus]SHG23465.1 hypothetical protein SAMN05216225_102163 [Ornithinibacillus halophilus]